MLIREREEVMERIVREQAIIERTQERIFILLTQCIADIQNTIDESGINLKDLVSDPRNSRQAWIISSMI